MLILASEFDPFFGLILGSGDEVFMLYLAHISCRVDGKSRRIHQIESYAINQPSKVTATFIDSQSIKGFTGRFSERFSFAYLRHTVFAHTHFN
jgi:hypothetical protein